jgi:hypothetical protein
VVARPVAAQRVVRARARELALRLALRLAD